MGLFSKKSSKPTTQAYAPPAGPPPPAQGSRINSAPQQFYNQSQPAQPHHQTQQQYVQPQYNQQQYGQPQYGQQQQYSAPAPARGGGNDPLASLSKFDTVFLVDDSESMEMFWEDQLSPALASIVENAVRYDSDGCDIAFFNDLTKGNVRSAQELRALFRKVWPSKSTPTADALRRVLEPYVSQCENWVIEGKSAGYPPPKPMNLIVLTDGAPNRGQNPESVIVDAARRLMAAKMSPTQLGIQFVQIGEDDEARDHLTALDDDLREKYDGITDLVDTTLSPPGGRCDTEYLMKALLGGIDREVDAQ